MSTQEDDIPPQRIAFYELGYCKACHKHKLLSPVVHLCRDCFEYQYVDQDTTSIYRDEISSMRQAGMAALVGFIFGVVLTCIVVFSAIAMAKQP